MARKTSRDCSCADSRRTCRPRWPARSKSGESRGIAAMPRPRKKQRSTLLAGLTFRSFDRVKRSGQHLFKTMLEKALFSSPAACLQTIRQRLKKLEVDRRPEATHDREQLTALEERVAAIAPAKFSKYQTLLKELAIADWAGLEWRQYPRPARHLHRAHRDATLSRTAPDEGAGI